MSQAWKVKHEMILLQGCIPVQNNHLKKKKEEEEEEQIFPRIILRIIINHNFSIILNFDIMYVG
jgi:hypothetical protein